MGSKTILVVDDEPDIAEPIVFLLTGYGYRVQVASNGSAALDMLAYGPPDLVLTDLMMPVVDGAELVQKVRTMDGFAATPIVVMSSLPQQIVRKECPLATAFLTKPFTFAELLDSLRDILGDAATSQVKLVPRGFS